MSIVKHHIIVDRAKPFADNLAYAINEYWRDQVAVPDGTRSAYEGDVIMNSRNGIPVQLLQKRRTHPAIIRVRKNDGRGNRWLIIDQDE